MGIESMNDQEVNKVEQMFEMYWKGKNINEVIRGASKEEIKEFAQKIIRDKNENLAINLLNNLLSGEYKIDSPNKEEQPRS